MPQEERLQLLGQFIELFGKPTPVQHQALGDGHELTIDRGEQSRPLVVQIFPDTQVVHLHSPLVDLTLRQAQVKGADEEALWIGGKSEEEWIDTMLSSDGKVIFASFPSCSEEQKQPHPLVAPFLRPKPEHPGPGIPETGMAPAEPAPANSPSKERERSNRHEWQGRIGKEPHIFNRRSDGKLTCRFDVTVPEEKTPQGKETWRTIYFYGERAEHLQGQLKQGQEVRVIAYRNEYTVKNPKTGALTTRESFQGARVIPLAKEDARQ